MARASYSETPLLRSLVHRPQGVILVLVTVFIDKLPGNLHVVKGNVRFKESMNSKTHHL